MGDAGFVERYRLQFGDYRAGESLNEVLVQDKVGVKHLAQPRERGNHFGVGAGSNQLPVSK
jgi:hypothetical protein